MVLSDTWPAKDDCPAGLAFCGLPPPAVDAVMNAFGFCNGGICDTTSTGTQPYTAQRPFIACWANPMLCACMMCAPLCSSAVFVRNLQQIGRITGDNGTCLEHAMACCVTGMFGLQSCHYASKRTELRKKYDIQGSRCEDFCIVCCFPACAVCQDANELQAREGTNYHIPKCSLQAGGAVAPAPPVKTVDEE